MVQARVVLDAVATRFGHRFTHSEHLIGGTAIEATGAPLPTETLEACRASDIVLLGAVGGPQWSDPRSETRPEEGLLALRKDLGLYANLRPVKTFSAIVDVSPLRRDIVDGTDILFVRELTGGIYFGGSTITDGGATVVSHMRYTVTEIERIVRLAARAAQERSGRLTSVDKANVLEVSRLWRQVTQRVMADEFPDVELETVLVDAMAMHLLSRPRDFDVVVTGNLFGDILTDEAAMLPGSLGLLASASLGAGDVGLYEPIHGSAPDIAGQGVANPLGIILSVAMALRHSLDLEPEARSIENAVNRVLSSGLRTQDIALGGRSIGTEAMGAAVAERVRDENRERSERKYALSPMTNSNTPSADFGVIGLAVMGQNLVLNLEDHGISVAVFNRTSARTDAFVSTNPGRSIYGFTELPAFVNAIARPRQILLMVKAGQPVDDQIDDLLPLLDHGDVIIDGGNSLYTDTALRIERLTGTGIHFVGAGISGGEEGARYGASIMPGGDHGAWPIVSDALTAIAASAEGQPCCEWIGSGGAGHYVKMVHNGIEYGDMQVIAEAYDIMGRGLIMTASEIQPWFQRWNEGRLDSYLIEITADILGHTEPDGTPTVDLIVDATGQKGTGMWTVIASMDQATPVSLIAESVYARVVSALRDERADASRVLGSTVEPIPDTPREVIEDLHDALYASKIVSYAQGFMLLSSASKTHGWDLDLGTIARLWRAGCIIRSGFLNNITAAYHKDPELVNLLLDDFFTSEITAALPGLRRTVTRAVTAGIPVPAYSAALSFFDAYRSKRLPANLTQAQRDYFGAHTYERRDRPQGEWFHTEWSRAQSGEGSRE